MKIYVPKRDLLLDQGWSWPLPLKKISVIDEYSFFCEPGFALDPRQAERQLAIAQGMQRYALDAEYHDEFGEAFFPTITVTNPRRSWT